MTPISGTGKEQDQQESGKDDGAAPSVPPFKRWVDCPPSGHGEVEDRAVRLFHDAAAPAPLSEQARTRVRTRLAPAFQMAHGARVETDRATAAGTAPRRKSRAPALHWGIAASLLLGSGVVIAARGVDRWWERRSKPTPVAEGERTAGTSNRPLHGRHRHGMNGMTAMTGSPPTTTPPAPPPAPPLAPPPTAEGQPAPFPALGSRSPVAAAGGHDRALRVAPTGAERSRSPGESRLSAEARLLKGAIGSLRQHGDAGAALVELDEYLRRFPTGMLVVEARTARVDALLMLGQRAEALAALEGLPLEGAGREQELRVIRGELRATSSCVAAVADFDRVLGTAAPPPLVERALHGRAVCRSRTGQMDEARSDAQQYLQRFPHGRFDQDARRLTTDPSVL